MQRGEHFAHRAMRALGHRLRNGRALVPVPCPSFKTISSAANRTSSAIPALPVTFGMIFERMNSAPSGFQHGVMIGPGSMLVPPSCPYWRTAPSVVQRATQARPLKLGFSGGAPSW